MQALECENREPLDRWIRASFKQYITLYSTSLNLPSYSPIVPLRKIPARKISQSHLDHVHFAKAFLPFNLSSREERQRVPTTLLRGEFVTRRRWRKERWKIIHVRVHPFKNFETARKNLSFVVSARLRACSVEFWNFVRASILRDKTRRGCTDAKSSHFVSKMHSSCNASAV